MTNSFMLHILLLCFLFNGCRSNPSGAEGSSHIDTTKLPQDIESKLHSTFGSIINLTPENNQVKEESLINPLLLFLKNPASAHFSANGHEKENILTNKSDDGRLKVFSWLSPFSGRRWFVQNIFQYTAKDRAIQTASYNRVFDEPTGAGTPMPFIDSMYILQQADGFVNYLLLGHGQMSGTEPYSTAHIIEIQGDHFKIKDELFLNGESPYVGLTITKTENTDEVKKQITIQYNPATKILTVPVTKQGLQGQILTGSNKVLKFRNGRF